MSMPKIALLLGWFLSVSAFAQNFPSRPVRIIMPFPAGTSVNDVLGRALAQRLSEPLGQQVIFDNRSGAAGTVGSEMVAKSPPDGYTLFMTSGSIVTANQHIYRKMPFDLEQDLVAITGAASGPQLIGVHPTLPAKSLKDFIAMAKAKPKSFSFGSAEIGRAHV